MAVHGRVLSRGVLVLLAWVVGTALAGTVAWGAVSRLGRDGDNASRPLSPAQVQARLALTEAAPTSHPQATTSGHPRGRQAARSRGAASAGRVGTGPGWTTRSWHLLGGMVGVTCHGSAVGLLYASPWDGWTYRLDEHARATLSVGFVRDRTISRLVAHCVQGTPARAAASDSEQGSDQGDAGE